jgi:hypothetical protein
VLSGLDRQPVGVGDVSIGRVRHRRIKTCAIAPLAAAQGVEEILIAVTADAGGFVGRDVGRVERPERQRKRQPAGIVRAARRGVANQAIGGAGEIFAALEQIGIGEIRRNAGRVGLMVIRERNHVAAGERQRSLRENPKHEHGGGNQGDEDNDRDAGAHDTYALTASARRSIGSRRSATPVAA